MTIKQLFIVRHGHSNFEAETDFQRELTIKGIEAVSQAAKFIKQQCKKNSITPQLCISSSAVRTLQTAKIMCDINSVEKCDDNKNLYSTSVSSWLDLIAQTTHNNIVIVGHNPTFSQMINVLCGKEIYMQPANCAFITLEIKPDGFVYPATLNSFHSNE